MPKLFKDQRGVLPLFFLISVGVAVLIGGSYIIREQFIKTSKSGQAELDKQKIREQTINKHSLPSLSPSPKIEPASESFTYKPVENKSGNQEDQEPSFKISGPAGWRQSNSSDDLIKVVFTAPQEDEVAAGEDLKATNQSKVQVNIIKGNGSGDLESLVNYYIDVSKPGWESLQINSKNKTILSGQPAYKIEIDAFKKGVSVRLLSYILIKGKYGIIVYGGSLKSAWDKRTEEIQGSLNSFQLTD